MLSIFLTVLTPKLPAPIEEDLSKGILEAIDMDSYRVEKRRTIVVPLPDQDAEIGTVPADGGGRRPEVELEGALPGSVVHAHPAPRASTDEQIARAFLEAKSLAGVFARLGVDARPALAWRCTHVSEALTAAFNDTLGGN